MYLFLFQGPQTTKPTGYDWRNHQADWFWVGKDIWFLHFANICGCHPMVQKSWSFDGAKVNCFLPWKKATPFFIIFFFVVYSYATPVDVWACGCILAELYTRKPLFDGKCERNQLTKIFEVLGTPDEENWPENAAVLRSNFVCMPKKAFSDVVPGLGPLAEDLLEVTWVWIGGRNKCASLIRFELCKLVLSVKNAKLTHLTPKLRAEACPSLLTRSFAILHASSFAIHNFFWENYTFVRK